MFKEERGEAQTLIERTIRRVVGRRALVAGFLIALLGGVIWQAGISVSDGVMAVRRALHGRVETAASGITKSTTGEFFVNYWEESIPGTLNIRRATTHIRQTADIDLDECMLRIVEKHDTILQHPVDENLESRRYVLNDFRRTVHFKLGTLRALDITSGINPDPSPGMNVDSATPYAVNVYVSNSDPESVVETISGKMGAERWPEETPLTMVGRFAAFHASSTDGGKEISSALLRLDTWCGNEEEPVVRFFTD